MSSELIVLLSFIGIFILGIVVGAVVTKFIRRKE